MLLLKKHLVALVREGKKHQTIRVWSRPIVRAGQISYTPGLGKMLILAVDELSGFDALTDLDARADGFADRAALLAELKNIYGTHLPPGKQCYRIRFQWPVDGSTTTKSAPVKPAPANASAKIPSLPRTSPNKLGPSKPRRASNSMTPTQRQKLKALLLQPATGAAARPTT